MARRLKAKKVQEGHLEEGKNLQRKEMTQKK
jgi:hypothetical protein